MSNGPLPSRLTLLSYLPSHGFGDKVRFLGCVTSYSIISGQLTLQHDFPKSAGVKALVDIRLLLEKLTVEQTSTGQWVNIIGYIASPPPEPLRNHSKRKVEVPTVHVQALVLWSAGALDLGQYEKCLANLTATTNREAKRQKENTT